MLCTSETHRFNLTNIGAIKKKNGCEGGRSPEKANVTKVRGCLDDCLLDVKIHAAGTFPCG